MSADGEAHELFLPPTGEVLLDASFVIALLDGDPAATRLAPVMGRATLTSVTAGEVYYKIAAGSGLTAAVTREVLLSLGTRIVDFPSSAALHFPRLRAVDAARRAEQEAAGERAAALSLADLCVLGHAVATGLPVLTGDRHWSSLERHGLSVDVHQFRDAERAP